MIWGGKKRARCNYNICSSHAVLYGQPTKSQCDTFEWLEDSLTATVVFCFMCRLHGKPNQARDQKDTLNTTSCKKDLDCFGSMKNPTYTRPQQWVGRALKTQRSMRTSHKSYELQTSMKLQIVGSISGGWLFGVTPAPDGDDEGNYSIWSVGNFWLRF